MDFIEIIDEKRVIRLAAEHAVYADDVRKYFDHYFDAVRAYSNCGYSTVDYSKPSFHETRGFASQPVFFPSLAEPAEASKPYLVFADLKEDQVVFDLGAYAGLSSMLFAKYGARVFAVEADPRNAEAARINFNIFENRTGKKIELIEAAVWKYDGEVSFGSEGNMGSYVTQNFAPSRVPVTSVPTMTLLSLAVRFSCDQVDFIKCDIEGAESEIFNQPEFFTRYSPRIIIEVHRRNGVFTTDDCVRALSQYGYKCETEDQISSQFPLLKCVRV